MNSVFPRPVLLALVVALIVGGIFLIQSRFATSDPEAASGESTPVTTGTAMQRSEEATTREMSSEETTEGPQQSVSPERSEADYLAEKKSKYERAKEIVSPTGFINTDADGITISENLEDRVVLLDFWTYSCFNCQNTQPYLNAWQEEYADDGLVIIGVHKPEFEFEKDYAGVEAAVRQAGIEYPVVLDNEDATWDAYDQRFWPTMYLIDSDGFVRYKHIGEGAYDETEATIQKLLAERDRQVG